MDNPNITYKALLIGNSIFEKDNTLNILNGPPNDIKAFREILTHEQVGLFDSENVNVLLESTTAEIMLALENFFISAKSKDLLLFYYSGHGLLDNSGFLYLCSRNTISHSIVSTGIAVDQIKKMMYSSPSSRIVIILDCCHSGGFKAAFNIPENLAGEGHFIISSTRKKDIAQDALPGDLSLFTKHFISALLSGDVDTDKNGYITLDEVYNHILPIMKDNHQIPEKSFDHAVGDIFIGRTPIELSEPILDVEPSEIIINNVDPAELLPKKVIEVFNRGEGSLHWTYESQDDWVKVERYKNSLSLSFDLKEGVNKSNLIIKDQNTNSIIIPIKISVNENSELPILELSENNIDFGSIYQNLDNVERVVRIYNKGQGLLNPKVFCNSPLINTELNDDFLKIKIDTSKLGVFDGEILVESDGGNKKLKISAFVEQGPILFISQDKVDFGTKKDKEKFKTKLTIENKGTGNLNWNYSTRGTWFETKRVKDGLSISGTAYPGKQNGSIMINSNGGDKTINLSIKVTETKKDVIKVNNNELAIQGNWRNDFGTMSIYGKFPYFHYDDYNLFGIKVGEGSITFSNTNDFTLQGYNFISLNVSGNGTLNNNMIHLTIISLFGTFNVIFYRS